MKHLFYISIAILFFACDYGKKEIYNYTILNTTEHDILLKSYMSSIDTIILTKETHIKANGGKFEILHLKGKWAKEPPLSPSSLQILSANSVDLLVSKKIVKQFTINEIDKDHNILNLNHYEKKKIDKHEHTYTYTITQADLQ